MWILISVGFIFLSFMLSIYLLFRQKRQIESAEHPPEVFKDEYTNEEFLSAKSYEHDRIKFRIVCNLIDTVESLISLFVFAKLWNFTRYGSETVHSILFTLLASFLMFLLGIPISYFSKFVIEEKHGFNKSTIKLFLTDLIKSLGLQIVLIIILIPILLFIYRKSGTRFVLYGAIFFLVFSILLQLIFPVFILPLFTKLTPLEDGEVKDSVNKLAREYGFPVSELYVSDDSKRSSKQNAMVFGLFKKKIAFADTLLGKCNAEEITAIVGHEIGHSKHKHIVKMMVLSQLSIILTLSLLYYIMKTPSVFIDFGFESEQPFLIGMVICGFLSMPIDTLLSLPINMLMRYFEFQADTFASSKGLRIDNALIKIGKENKVAIDPDPLYSAFENSHPTLQQRVTKAREILKKLE